MTNRNSEARPLDRCALSVLVLLAVATTGCEKSAEPAQIESGESPADPKGGTTAFDFTLHSIEGQERPLSEFSGKVMLVVNVASNCGFTPQYEGLQELHERYESQGLVVMGVPSNDFMGQEPGSNEEIKTFCESKYHVTFPMFSKVKVKGEGQHPLYAWLTAEKGSVGWNFNKFLIGRDGRIIEKFGSRTKPLSAEMLAGISAALSEKSAAPSEKSAAPSEKSAAPSEKAGKPPQ